MLALSKDAGRPLYVQLYELIRDQVRAGTLKPGDAIAAESELTRTYGVSRITVRAALDQLVREGYIDRYRGRGSYVKSTNPETRACLASFTDQMLSVGRRPRTDVLGLRIDVTAAFVARTLPFSPDVEVVRIERLRWVDGVRVALVHSYIPYDLVRGIDARDFADEGPAQSLLYVLEHRFGVVLDQGEETLVPVNAQPPVTELLGVSGGDAIALKICTVRDVTGTPVLYEEASWSGPQTQLVRRVPQSP